MAKPNPTLWDYLSINPDQRFEFELENFDPPKAITLPLIPALLFQSILDTVTPGVVIEQIKFRLYHAQRMQNTDDDHLMMFLAEQLYRLRHEEEFTEVGQIRYDLTGREELDSPGSSTAKKNVVDSIMLFSIILQEIEDFASTDGVAFRKVVRPHTLANLLLARIREFMSTYNIVIDLPADTPGIKKKRTGEKYFYEGDSVRYGVFTPEPAPKGSYRAEVLAMIERLTEQERRLQKLREDLLETIS